MQVLLQNYCIYSVGQQAVVIMLLEFHCGGVLLFVVSGNPRHESTLTSSLRIKFGSGWDVLYAASDVQLLCTQCDGQMTVSTLILPNCTYSSFN